MLAMGDVIVRKHRRSAHWKTTRICGRSHHLLANLLEVINVSHAMTMTKNMSIWTRVQFLAPLLGILIGCCAKHIDFKKDMDYQARKEQLLQKWLEREDSAEFSPPEKDLKPSILGSALHWLWGAILIVSLAILLKSRKARSSLIFIALIAINVALLVMRS